jgi:GT2 family glycosyltransferase
MMPIVTTIVLNWRRADDSLRCIASLRGLTYPSHQIVFVDNGSRDGSLEQVAAAYPDILTLQTGENQGYAGGNNVGLRRALDDAAEYILVLNNDTTVDSALLDHLVAFAQSHPGLGAATPKILDLNGPNTVWSAGCDLDMVSVQPAQRGTGQVDDGSFDASAPSDYAVGAALFMTRSALEQVGLFDEDYFLVFEDLDWSIRARRAGFEIWYVPTARVWHRGSASFGATSNASDEYRYYWTRNALLFVRRHVAPPARWIAYARLLIRWTRYAAHWWRSDRAMARALTPSMVAGIVDFGRGRFGARRRATR